MVPQVGIHWQGISRNEKPFEDWKFGTDEMSDGLGSEPILRFTKMIMGFVNHYNRSLSLVYGPIICLTAL